MLTTVLEPEPEKHVDSRNRELWHHIKLVML